MQLEKLDIDLVDSMYSITNGDTYKNMEPGSGFILGTSFTDDGVLQQSWRPMYDSFIKNAEFRLPLDAWMNRTILFGEHKKKYSRLQLNKDMANQDRGVHRGTVLSADYHALSRKQSKVISRTWVPGNGIADPTLFNNDAIRIEYSQKGAPLRFTRAIIRQIAHETLISLLPEDKKIAYRANLPALVEEVHPMPHILVRYTEEYK